MPLRMPINPGFVSTVNTPTSHPNMWSATVRTKRTTKVRHCFQKSLTSMRDVITGTKKINSIMAQITEDINEIF